MEVNNLSIKNHGLKKEHHPLLPRSLRSLIIGKSNCGKSTLLYNFLLRPGWLDYNNLLVFGNSLHQIEYQTIKEGYEKGLKKTQILNIFQNQKLMNESGMSPLQVIADCAAETEGETSVKFYEDTAQIPDPSKLDPKKKESPSFR